MNIQKSLLLALCVVASGCMTSRDYGDRAFDAGRYNEALDNYEKAVEEGVRDHEMFRRAAQASLNTGDFSGAERYYSQALRNGAGLDVARELAQFYVKTNNFVSAVRVYEYLLNTDPNVQAVYNNLGTALLYANKPFDAETYLMIAQQMEPDDPYPYLNLGILYDQHLRQPRESVGFYRCYQQFAPKQDSTYQLTVQRIAEIEERWGEDPPIVTCGKPFEPQKAKAVVDLRKELQVEGELDLGMEGPTEGPVEVQLLVTEPVVAMVPAETNQAKRGDEAWTARDWAEVVKAYSALTVTELDAVRRYRLGAAELQLGHAAAATSWLQLSLASAEDPATVTMLLDAYRATDDGSSVARLCARYQTRDGYAEATKSCPKPATVKETPKSP